MKTYKIGDKVFVIRIWDSSVLPGIAVVAACPEKYPNSKDLWVTFIDGRTNANYKEYETHSEPWQMRFTEEAKWVIPITSLTLAIYGIQG